MRKSVHSTTRFVRSHSRYEGKWRRSWSDYKPWVSSSQPVQFADWAAPIVPLAKSDGRIHKCGYYKITVNRAARLKKYPIPRIEELFGSLAGGKSFTKLDLSHAYLLIPLDEKSCLYVVISTHKGIPTDSSG